MQRGDMRQQNKTRKSGQRMDRRAENLRVLQSIKSKERE